MSQAAHPEITPDAFCRWLSSRTEGRYELVDGEPVMTSGADNRPDRIVRNALRHFGNHLDGHRRQPFTADINIPIPSGHVPGHLHGPSVRAHVPPHAGPRLDRRQTAVNPQDPRFAAVYAGLTFRPRPRLVGSDGTDVQ